MSPRSSVGLKKHDSRIKSRPKIDRSILSRAKEKTRSREEGNPVRRNLNAIIMSGSIGACDAVHVADKNPVSRSRRRRWRVKIKRHALAIGAQSVPLRFVTPDGAARHVEGAAAVAFFLSLSLSSPVFHFFLLFFALSPSLAPLEHR